MSFHPQPINLKRLCFHRHCIVSDRQFLSFRFYQIEALSPMIQANEGVCSAHPPGVELFLLSISELYHKLEKQTDGAKIFIAKIG
jgi:hypothetical protein